MARFISALIALLFVSMSISNNVLAVENISWGQIKSVSSQNDESGTPVGKLTISANKAGGWRGIRNQPYIEAAWDDELHSGRGIIFQRSWTNRGWSWSVWFRLTNPTGVRINSIDVLFTYDEDVFRSLGINTDFSATTSIQGGMLKAAMRLAEGYNTDITNLFRLFLPVRADAPIGHTTIVCSVTMYGENGGLIAVQTKRWVVNIE